MLQKDYTKTGKINTQNKTKQTQKKEAYINTTKQLKQNKNKKKEGEWVEHKIIQIQTYRQHKKKEKTCNFKPEASTRWPDIV